MKLSTTALLFPLIFILTACSAQNLIYQSDKPTPAATTPAPQVTVDQVKKQVETYREKYNDPKWATLRSADYKSTGRIYMQYDKETDKTYIWLEVNNFEKQDNLVVKLIDNKQKDEAKNQIILGKIMFDQDDSGWLAYEFAENGNFYSYLKAQVLPENSEEKLLEANFNPKLL